VASNSQTDNTQFEMGASLAILYNVADLMLMIVLSATLIGNDLMAPSYWQILA